MVSNDGIPTSQIFADDLDTLIERYAHSGLENCQAIGCLHAALSNIEAEMREKAKEVA